MGARNEQAFPCEIHAFLDPSTPLPHRTAEGPTGGARLAWGWLGAGGPPSAALRHWAAAGRGACSRRSVVMALQRQPPTAWAPPAGGGRGMHVAGLRGPQQPCCSFAQQLNYTLSAKLSSCYCAAAAAAAACCRCHATTSA